MSRPDESDGDELLELRRDSIWEDPRVAPKYIPERMTSEELLGWFSYHIRDNSVPMRIRMALAKDYAAMMRLTGPTQVTNVIQHNQSLNIRSEMNTEKARALVAELGERFRQLPSAKAPTTSRLSPTTPTSIQATVTTPSSSKKP